MFVRLTKSPCNKKFQSIYSEPRRSIVSACDGSTVLLVVSSALNDSHGSRWGAGASKSTVKNDQTKSMADEVNSQEWGQGKIS